MSQVSEESKRDELNCSLNNCNGYLLANRALDAIIRLQQRVKQLESEMGIESDG